METISFDLARTVQEALHIITPKAEEKGLSLYVNMDDIPSSLLGDPLRIRQIMVNLLSNAVKFTDAGCVSLEVKAIRSPHNIWQLRICVTDSGIGMSPSQMARIFNRYEQADASIRRKYGGTGLGLAICRDIAYLMQGEILVESTPGMGSCFTALLHLCGNAMPHALLAA